LPEADYLRLTAERLTQALGDAPLIRADLRWPTIAGANLAGRQLLEAVSYGKHLLLRFDDGRTLHVHFRMEGLFKMARTGTPQALGRGAGVRAVLSTANWTAIGHELGMMDLLATKDEKRLLQKLGPEILAPDFETNYLGKAVANLGKYEGWPLCAALLQQDVVAGIGTIWMAETLWNLKLYPWLTVSELSNEEREKLLATAHRLLTKCVAVARAKGLSAVPRRAHGQHKRFCIRCGRTPIAVSALSGPDGSPDQGAFDRVVFWCPTCQRPTVG